MPDPRIDPVLVEKARRAYLDAVLPGCEVRGVGIEAVLRVVLDELRLKEERREAKAVEALRGVIDAYDGWSVNAYPADGGTRSAADVWFAEAQRVDEAVERARPLTEPLGGLSWIEQGDAQ